jgi:hypothetical protein
MSSTYRVLCLSHDPAMVAADGDWNRASMAEEAIAAGVEGHETCDLLIGRYSYPLVEVGCPATKDGPGSYRCIHGGTQWADVDWLRLLAIAQREPADTDLGRAAEEAGRRCWSPERLRRLGPDLGVGPRPEVALCGDPGPGASDLTNPCSLPLGHDKHRDQDGCSWPAPAVPVEARLYGGQAEPLEPPTVPPCHIDHDCPGQVRQPPHCGCAAWDRGERHPAHQWYSSTRGRVSCNGEPPFGAILRGDRVRVTYEADWGEVLSSGGRMVLAGGEPGNRCHNVIPDSAIVEVIGRAGDGA